MDLDKILLFRDAFSTLMNLDIFNSMYKKQSLSLLNMH